MKLSDLINIEDKKERQRSLKKAFMPYSELIEVDGSEEQAIIILLNLSRIQPKSNDYLERQTADLFLRTDENVEATLAQITWFHTHNLKYPDCRVKDQRLIATVLPTEEKFISSVSLKTSYGWSHNGAAYSFTIWLLSEFIWRGEVVSLLSLIKEEDNYWLDLLKRYGFFKKNAQLFKEYIQRDFPSQSFPNEVSQYSKQVRFPWRNDYLAVTPVVNHTMQCCLERLSRCSDSSLSFRQIQSQNSASVGNLPASVGGRMNVLFSPLDITVDKRQTLLASRLRSHKYFDDGALTDRAICDVFRHLIGTEPLTTNKKQRHVRSYQVKKLRQRIALWLLPLIELRDQYGKPTAIIDEQQFPSVIFNFVTLNEDRFVLLADELNQCIHLSLQSNKFSSRYAYHPKLVSLLKLELTAILKQLSEQEVEQTRSGNEQYIYLSDLRVFQGLALSSPYLCGVPSMTAVWGFIHQFQRSFAELMQVEEDVEFDSFAIFFKQEFIYKDSVLPEASKLAAKRTVSSVKRTTFKGEYHADLVLDMLIKVKTSIDLKECISLLQAALPTRFAGGSLFQPEILSSDDWLYVTDSKVGLFHRAKGLPNYGMWLTPESQQPLKISDLVYFIENDRSLIPISAGYHFLESPKQREGCICSHHVYAENVIMLAKKVKPINVRLEGIKSFFKNAFWSLDVNSSTILIKKE
ncbi:hypothetical protein L4D13_01160 [Photobacterium profundum]|uniref:type I-F CRISPR-associated protein Csy2 n=1 Tax=Photobacterium profundum TaxID=74109 RepID=UPI003D14ABB8